MKGQTLNALQILVTIGLLMLALYQAGLTDAAQRRIFIDVLTGADLRILVLAVAMGVVINMSSALKWYMLIRARGLIAGYWRVFCYYVVGQFYNLLLPTSVGGDVVRSYELGKYTGRQADALASVFVERYTGILILLLVAGLAVISQLNLFLHVGFVLTSLGAFVVILAAIAWMVFDQRPYNWFRGLIIGWLPASGKLFVKVDKLLAAVHVYGKHRSAIVWAIVNSLVFYFLAVVNIYVTALVFEAQVAFVDILIATPIIMLIMNLPISVGNLGLMEFAYINVLQLMGYSPALGLSVAILMRIKSLFDAALGGILHPFFVTRKYE